MNFKVAISLLLCLLTLQLQAQSYYEKAITYEAGISIGPMNSLTDIGGTPGFGKRGPKDLNIKSTTLFGSVYGSAVYKHFAALRLEATAGRIKSNDSLLKGIHSPNKAIGRYNRNLSFRSAIYEISLTGELHPISLLSGYDPVSFPPTFSPYLIGGIGFFHFNPQALLNSEWIDLRPLHTEGQGFAEYPGRKEYKLNQFNIPLGIGISYEATSKFNLRLEYISRKTFTDYLDDVHDTYINPDDFKKYLSGDQLNQALILNNRVRADAVANQTTARPGGRRGNPLNNDSYFTINLKLGFVFGRDESSSGGGGGFGGGGGGNSDRKLQRLQRQQRSCPRLF